jgi:hypothetical protein
MSTLLREWNGRDGSCCHSFFGWLQARPESHCQVRTLAGSAIFTSSDDRVRARCGGRIAFLHGSIDDTAAIPRYFVLCPNAPKSHSRYEVVELHSGGHEAFLDTRESRDAVSPATPKGTYFTNLMEKALQSEKTN